MVAAAIGTAKARHQMRTVNGRCRPTVVGAVINALQTAAANHAGLLHRRDHGPRCRGGRRSREGFVHGNVVALRSPTRPPPSKPWRLTGRKDDACVLSHTTLGD